MKSRFQNNLDGAADMGTYFELSLQRFIIQMPQYAGMLAGAPIDFSDPRYIVRFRFLKNGRIDLEVGYPEDSEWRIGQPDTSKQLSYPSANEEIETLLDDVTLQGGSFFSMPLSEYIEMYPETRKLFENFDIDSKAVCFYRDDNRNTKMIVGKIDNDDEDWERIIRDFEQEKKANTQR